MEAVGRRPRCQREPRPGDSNDAPHRAIAPRPQPLTARCTKMIVIQARGPRGDSRLASRHEGPYIEQRHGARRRDGAGARRARPVTAPGPMVDLHRSRTPRLRRSWLFFEDLPAVHRRRERKGDRDVLTEATAGKRPDYYQQNFQRFCCHQSTALAIAISHPLSRFYFVYSQHAELDSERGRVPAPGSKTLIIQFSASLI